jgi:hypothetical protein
LSTLSVRLITSHRRVGCGCLTATGLERLQLGLIKILFIPVFAWRVGRDRSVGIATRYGLGGPGIESRWGSEVFRTCPDRPLGPPNLLYNGYRVFPGGKAAGV